VVRALPDGRQRWREDAIGRLLDTEDGDVLFVARCEENQVRFHPRFDLIILLSAPAGVLAERLASRTGNSFGKAPGELERILDDLRAVEPLLRTVATHEIRTHQAARRCGRGDLAPGRRVSMEAGPLTVRHACPAS
jgi:hypothetical protein